MEKNLQQEDKKWPEIVFSSGDSTQSQAIRRAVQSGKLRKIAPRLYTSNLVDAPSSIIAKNCYHILGTLFPGAILSYRSALEGGVSSHNGITLTYKYTKKVLLPGLTVYLLKGEGVQPGDTAFMGTLFIASRARALLENLQPSRGKEKKTLSREYIEALLDKLCRVYGEEELNKLRDEAKILAKKLHLEKENHLLEKMIGALLGSQAANVLQTELARARAIGQPYDSVRIELFSHLMLALKKEILPIREENIYSVQQLHNIAFFEAYFSNYIEGTEFAVDEAKDIIFKNKLVPNRPQDAHDIIATFQIVANIPEMSKIPKSNEDLINILKYKHSILMEARKDKTPGNFKGITNRVGNTIFVLPELVEGTLSKAFSLYEALEPGIARAIFIKFMISEIHPFLDGNGRIARIMMNAELVHSRLCRIIIPTVYREDYLLALRRLSRTGDPEAYIRMLLRAQEFTASIDFSEYENALKSLDKSNAFMEPHEGKLIIPRHV